MSDHKNFRCPCCIVGRWVQYAALEYMRDQSTAVLCIIHGHWDDHPSRQSHTSARMHWALESMVGEDIHLGKFDIQVAAPQGQIQTFKWYQTLALPLSTYRWLILSTTRHLRAHFAFNWNFYPSSLYLITPLSPFFLINNQTNILLIS